MQFEEAASLFKNNNIKGLAQSPDGLRFLKLRSLSRNEECDIITDLDCPQDEILAEISWS